MKLFSFTDSEIYSILEEEGMDQEFDGKCGGCNWEVSHFYILADSYEDAVEAIKQIVSEGGSPLCGNCLCEMLVEEDYEITRVER